MKPPRQPVPCSWKAYFAGCDCDACRLRAVWSTETIGVAVVAFGGGEANDGRVWF